MAVQVTIYLTEGDSWHHRPLHLEILKYLREENVFGAVAFHAVAGFLGRGRVHTAHRPRECRHRAGQFGLRGKYTEDVKRAPYNECGTRRQEGVRAEQ
jgi:hypothetical protein